MKQKVKNLIYPILEKMEIKLSLDYIIIKWNEKHRFYHNEKNHLSIMLDDIIKYKAKYDLDEDTFDIMIISTLFHDIVYNPKSTDNEKESITLFENNVNKITKKHNEIISIIESTKNQNIKTKNQELFNSFDLNILTKDLPKLIEWENQIYKEYEFVNWKTYKENRVKILEDFIEKRTELPIEINYNGLNNLIYIIKNKKPNIGIYAGSFNPYTIAHKNIYEKSERIFDKVILAKDKNDSKKVDDFQYETELKNLIELYPTKEIINYSGLLTDLIKKQEGQITLIRGLRNGYDLEAENTLITYMKDMYPDLNVIYIPCDKEFEHISSSAIRTIRKHGDDLVQRYLQ